LTPLSYALLGLVRQQPRSGYGLRKVFETTPLGSYSSSPGSIYPALKALETAGLVEVRGGETARGKGLYHLTAKGSDALDAWLVAPIGDVKEALLRFAFLDEDDRPGILAFLASFEAAVRAQIAGLDGFLAGEDARAMTLKGRIAVEHGRRGLLASAEWASWARERFEQEQGEDP
jgi:DNA-binding PadR family transcriptional regulator